MALTQQQIAEVNQRLGITPKSSSPRVDNSSLIERVRAAAKKGTEDQSAESVGALFPAKTGEGPMTAGLKAVGNTPSSVFNLGKSIYQAVRHPIQTGKAVGLATTGSLDSLLEKVVGDELKTTFGDQGDDQETIRIAKQVGTELKKRYGSLEALQRTATNDPFGFGTDVLTVLSGIAPAGAALKGTEVARVASKAADVAAIPRTAAREAVAGALESSAAKSISKVLEPTKDATKAQTMKIAPELSKRTPFAWSRQGLEDKFASNAESAGQAIDDALKALPEDSRVNVEPILKEIEDTKSQFVVKGTGDSTLPPVIANPNAWQAADDLQQLILSVSKDGKTAPVESIRSLRQIWDREVAASKGFTKDLKEGTKIDLTKDATNAIRKELAKEFPDIDVLNKEYTLWKTAEDILAETNKRRTGREMSATQKGAVGAGGVGGASIGGLKEAAIGAATVAALVAAMRSTAWRTVSAAVKSRLAEAIYANNQAEIKKIITPLLGEQAIDIATEENQ